ncbi:hypothetical protein, partial [Klebsiella aerogenes]|uniref:hypothetical protein n=1 Tax=Klebsiella aerogenes TaxID=548 RepID=UPI001953AD68
NIKSSIALAMGSGAKVHNLVAAELTALSSAIKEHAVEVCTGALRLLTAGQNTGATKLVVLE